MASGLPTVARLGFPLPINGPDIAPPLYRRQVRIGIRFQQPDAQDKATSGWAKSRALQPITVKHSKDGGFRGHGAAYAKTLLIARTKG